ncbi:MAG: rhomboid family intramembrane serine protease [Verrucomicrobia bacterium]|nr:rhomboid family intramembrane serine protease [Verrucomicrobiota bacterium]
MRATPYSPRWSASVILVTINAVVFGLQLILALSPNPAIFGISGWLALTPSHLAQGKLWELFTFQFLHGGPTHLIFNCAMLWMFGRVVEERLGRADFYKLYLLSGAIGGLLQASCSWVFPGHFGRDTATVGASAGVCGLVAAFAALNWEEPITTFIAMIFPVTMRAKYLVLVTAVVAVFGMLERRSQIAHAAHLGGLLAGLGYIHFVTFGHRSLNLWRIRPRARPRPELVKVNSPGKSLWPKREQVADDSMPPAEFISREVDPILDKISAHGIHSLTARERQILEAARARMGKR